MRPKLTPAEQEVQALWDELVFPGGRYQLPTGSGEELCQGILDQQEAWNNLLGRAYGEGGWTVGWRIAATIASSRWYQKMILRDYAKAELELRRWFEHSDVPNADRHWKARAKIMLLVAQLAQGDHEASAEELTNMIEAGPYSGGTMASLVYHALAPLLDDLPGDSTPSQELVTLCVAIATRRRASNGSVLTCANSSSLVQLRERLARCVGYSQI